MADFIKVSTTPGFPQTMPTSPEKRIPSSDIQIALCDESDAEKIAEGIYVAFPEAYWAKREPPSIRPTEHSTRVRRLATRLRPSFSNPHMSWLKAVHLPTSTIVGIAGWMGPGHPVHTIFRRTATDFYGWKEKCNWSDEDIEEMWSGTDLSVWDGQFEKDDALRREVFGDEEHWYLAPLLTWPEWQGRGVGKLLMQWAIEKADNTVPHTPMYLESAAYARAVYMHLGFVPQGATNMVRRGPAVVRGLEAEEEKEKEKEAPQKVEKESVEAVAKEAEAELASK